MNQRFCPTVLVSQYSNWTAEATRTNRVFIDNLDAYCKKEYKEFYKGAVRFSHTELEWQTKLKQIIYSLQEMASAYSERGDYATAIEFYKNELQQSPDNLQPRLKLADAYRKTGNFTLAIEAYQHVQNLENTCSDALAGLALAYAEIGDTGASESYYQRFRTANAEQAESLQERILDAKLKTINQQRQQLYQSEMMATLGQMAAGMAHELNTPLQEIMTIAQSTNRFMKKDKISPDEIEENLNRIVNAVKLMAGQVNHIRTLAKDDHLKTEPVNLNTVIQSTFDFFKQQLKNHTIAVQLNLHKNLPDIIANSSRIEQIFINLIQNAKDALVPVKGRKKEIIVRTRYTRGDIPLINIYFEDNGTGMEEIVKQQIFDPFFTTKPLGKGMGIGLSIVKESITELGATITLFGESSIGVTFIITIPLRNQSETRRPELNG